MSFVQEVHDVDVVEHRAHPIAHLLHILGNELSINYPFGQESTHVFVVADL